MNHTLLANFTIEGFTNPFRLDRDKFGGGVMIFVNSHLPVREIPFETKPNDVEVIFLELTLRSKRWLMAGGYCPTKESAPYFFDHVSRQLDSIMASYEHILILGDFNMTMNEEAMTDFCELYDFENLLHEPTCYKNAKNPSSIDVILTNSKNCFQNSSALETGLSDCHKLVVTVLKTYIKKKDPARISHRSYKNFNLSIFRTELKQNLEQFNKEIMTYDDFKYIFMKILGLHGPMKERVVRDNNQPFVTKKLRKAIMTNFCVSLLRKEKKKYYNNLDLKIFDDNKRFWRSVKPLFSDKQKSIR